MSDVDLVGLVVTIAVVALPLGAVMFWLGHSIGLRKAANMRWSGDDEA